MADQTNERLAIDRIRYLFGRYMDQSITEAEERELAALAMAPENDLIIIQLEQEYWDKEPAEQFTEEEIKKYLTGILGASKTKVRSIGWRRIAVAASILLVIGIGGYFLFLNKPGVKTEVVQTQDQRFRNDIDPGKFKARLRLADGRIVVLDSAADGELAKQGNTRVINKDGQLVYKKEGGDEQVLYNTVSTAKAEIYATVLSDGTKVWLNSASSITFPVVFTGKERKVEITGEAYFEVARSNSPQGGGPGKTPFIVKKGDVEVLVLGTHFNVNAYDDEEDIKVTLLEGSVKISNNSGTAIIKPGQQSRIAINHKPETINDPDLEEVMAWKNGRFYFENTSVETIMRQVERWYDVEIEYQDKVPHLFVAKIPREVPVSELLKLLELTDRVHFKIEGRKITVMK